LLYVQNGAVAAEVALGLSAKDAESFIGFGVTLLEEGRNAEALACAEVATAVAPKAFGAWLLRACASARLKRKAEALLCYGQAAQIDPKNVRVWVDMGELHLHMLDYVSAAADFQRALDLDPEAKTGAGKRALMLVASTYFGDDD
jgi:tetratricopeptide (TPR) repeat protein